MFFKMRQTIAALVCAGLVQHASSMPIINLNTGVGWTTEQVAPLPQPVQGSYGTQVGAPSLGTAVGSQPAEAELTERQMPAVPITDPSAPAQEQLTASTPLTGAPGPVLGSTLTTAQQPQTQSNPWDKVVQSGLTPGVGASVGMVGAAAAVGATGYQPINPSTDPDMTRNQTILQFQQQYIPGTLPGAANPAVPAGQSTAAQVGQLGMN